LNTTALQNRDRILAGNAFQNTVVFCRKFGLEADGYLKVIKYRKLWIFVDDSLLKNMDIIANSFQKIT
jgi:hypothetical protein